MYVYSQAAAAAGEPVSRYAIACGTGLHWLTARSGNIQKVGSQGMGCLCAASGSIMNRIFVLLSSPTKLVHPLPQYYGYIN